MDIGIRGVSLEGLRALEERHRLIGDVRGLGLMVGIEMKDRVHPVVESLMDRGVVALTAGTTVLRLLPPLVLEATHVKRLAEALRDSA